MAENVTWVKQNDSVSVETCQVETQSALEMLAQWFFDKTGARLVVTAGTNGQHQSGTYSHENGWKLDINDWYGPDGLGGEYLGYPLDSNGTELLDAFRCYGHSIGCGMSIEGNHVDVECGGDGYEWKTETSWGGFNGKVDPSKAKLGSAGSKGKGGLSSGKSSYDGCKVMPAGGKRVTVTKLPEGKTFCEPVYPDLITVSDIVPKWVLDKTISNVNQSAEYQKLVDDYAKFTKEFEAFKETQFEAWCKVNNKDFSTEVAKKTTMDDYTLAIKASDQLFTNGIYNSNNDGETLQKIKDYMQKDKDFQDKIAATKSKQDSDSSNGQAEATTTATKDTKSNADMAANAKATAGTNEIQTDN